MTPPNTTGAQALSDEQAIAVNLARTMLTVRDCKGITTYGVRVLCEAVMKMDAALSSREQAGAVAVARIEQLALAIKSTETAEQSMRLVADFLRECAAPGAAAAAREQEAGEPGCCGRKK